MEKVFGVFMGASENAFQATAKVCRSREKREKKLQRLAILSNFHSSPLLFNGLQARFLLLLKDTQKKKQKKSRFCRPFFVVAEYLRKYTIQI